MFYLLEDNRIIDSKKYNEEPYVVSEVVVANQKYLHLNSFKDQVLVMGKIKKQSDNVIDLIEKK